MSFRVDRHNLALERTPRATRACAACHKRKVRCDVSSSRTQCTNCWRHDQPCEPLVRQKRQKSIVRSGTGQDRLPASTSASTPSREPLHRLVEQSSVPTAETHRSTQPDLPLNADLQTTRDHEPTPHHAQSTESPIGTNRNGAGFMERSLYIAPVNFRNEDGSEVEYAAHVSSDVNSKILEMQHALELPPRSVRDGLFENFWTYCYPWDPIIEKSHIIGVPPDKQSPLLLQAVFLAGSRMASSSASYATSHEFYQRAKTLFYFNHERDPMKTLIAVSLLHWHNNHGPERVSTDTTTFWCRVAVSLAHQMGLHRQTRHLHDESLRRRLWWSLVVSAQPTGCNNCLTLPSQARDFLVSLAHGRPQAIDLDDSDVPRLTIDDFPDSTLTGFTFMSYVDLSIILGRFTKQTLRRVPASCYIRDIEDSLYQWLRKLPDPVRMSPHGYNDQKGPLARSQHFACRQVHVLYLVSLIVLYRAGSVEGFPVAAVVASSAIAGIFEEFLARDEVRLLGPVFTFHLLAAAIALLSCYKYPALWIVAQQDLKVIGQAQEEMKKKWPSAMGSIRSFERMYNLTFTTQKKVGGSPETKLIPKHAVFFQDLDTGLCRMWDTLRQANVITSDVNSFSTRERGSIEEAVINQAPALNNAPEVDPVAYARQIDVSTAPSLDSTLLEESPLMYGGIGDWLFLDQMAFLD